MDQLVPNPHASTSAIHFINRWFGATERPIYICSLANDRSDSNEPIERHTATRDSDVIDAFVARRDLPERGLYVCVSTLYPDMKRCKENVAEVPGLWADIDFKDVDDDEATILRRVQGLSLAPSIMVRSCNGLHLYYRFKEPIGINIIDGAPTIERIEAALKLLADLVGGDMKVTQVAALMRLPGTHNSKRDEWKECELIETGVDFVRTYELDDLEQMLAETAPVVLRKARPIQRTTGESELYATILKELGFKSPLDVEKRLAGMMYMGGEEASIHGTQLSVTASLLNAGREVDEIVSLVLKATRAASGADHGGYGKHWNWEREQKAIRGMCASWVKKHPVGESKIKPSPDLPPADKELILTSGNFVRDFIPPDYLLDGVLLCGFVYALTAPTGHGKTAVLLSFTAAVSRGPLFAGREVTKGRVLYFAGENPDDVRMRWIGMAHKLAFDPDDIDVSFIPGVYDIKSIESRVYKEVDAIGGVVLVVIDTSPAYFHGDNENDNPQMIAHAQMLYRLRLLPGNPTVLAACHPVKNAARDNLIPRGGGGFLNAIDGNLTAWRGEDGIVTIGTQGKFRGPEFEPILFELVGVTTAKLTDKKGRLIPTVVAMALSKDAEAAKRSTAHSEGDAILLLLYDHKDQGFGMSGVDIAKALHWMAKDNVTPAKTKVQRAIAGLNPNKGDKLVESSRDGYTLTKKGHKAGAALDRIRLGEPLKPELKHKPKDEKTLF